MMILKTSRGALSSGGFDRMAARYISAVETAGATVTSTQRNAIDAFFKTGKSQGWISSLRRVYLPIWAAAAPNAIDMMTIASGTFVFGVTHSSGFVQGNGTTGYFDFGSTMPNDGLTSASGLLFCLVKVANTSATSAVSMLGHTNASNTQVIRQSTASNIQGRYTGTSLNLNGGNARAGILSLSSISNTSRSFRRRLTSGVTSLTTSAGEAAFTLSNVNCFAMARNSSGISEPTNAELGAYGYSMGLSDFNTDAFTLALKTLWETSTGLTLP